MSYCFRSSGCNGLAEVPVPSGGFSTANNFLGTFLKGNNLHLETLLNWLQTAQDTISSWNRSKIESIISVRFSLDRGFGIPALSNCNSSLGRKHWSSFFGIVNSLSLGSDLFSSTSVLFLYYSMVVRYVCSFSVLSVINSFDSLLFWNLGELVSLSTM